MNNTKLKASNSAEVLTLMFSRMDHNERAWTLNFIDNFIIDYLGIKRENLPWLNGKNEHHDWDNIVVLLRLAVARIFNEYQMKLTKKRMN
jgi:hypothetical protein